MRSCLACSDEQHKTKASAGLGPKPVLVKTYLRVRVVRLWCGVMLKTYVCDVMFLLPPRSEGWEAGAA